MSVSAGLFALRHQRGGYIREPLFTAPPSPKRLAAEQARLDGLHGPGWLRVVPLAVELAPEHEDLAARLAPPPEQPAPAGPAEPRALPGLVFRATGNVTPPR
ncbi:hypothetical protein [Sorangium sp. So ce233]|uniref:hypothetical protein n=1 Tax=Sorangium sp. So ce233 TaxID=3133290 RepID=UPI003F637CA9